MPELMIFKAGKYPQGDWPKERLQKMVDAYDPEKNIEAPVVIGHRNWSGGDEAQFAHGWVKSIRMDGSGKVFADVPEFSSKVKQALAEKNLRYISVEIIEFDKYEDAASPPYLRAISLLGRDTPAVHGAKLPTLFDFFNGGASVVTLNEEEHTAAFTRKVNADDLLSFGQQVIPVKEGTMDEPEKLKAELAAKEKELAEFKAEFDAMKSAGRKQEATAYFGELRDAGKLTPALFDKAVALDARLGEEERKELRALFGELETKVDLSGAHTADKGKAPAPTLGDAGLAAKIRAFQTEKKIVSFSDAAEALFAEKPELFVGGEA
jgi:hypothetical protein